MQTATTKIDQSEVEWETWPSPAEIDPAQVRWKMLLSSDKTPTSTMCVGLAEIAPGGHLPRHKHLPAEIYYGLRGTGIVKSEAGELVLQPERTIFIAPDTWHLTQKTGKECLLFLFIFPRDGLASVQYDFASDDAGQAAL